MVFIIRTGFLNTIAFGYGSIGIYPTWFIIIESSLGNIKN